MKDKGPRVDRRTSVAAWACHMLDSDAVFLDTETTGIREGAEIVDIAVVSSDGKIKFESLVQPKGLIPEESTKIHGITDLDVADAPKWVDVYGHVTSAIGGRPVIVYNMDFDLRIIQWQNRQHQLPQIYSENWHCAMIQYSKFVGEPPATMRHKRNGYKWHRLEDAIIQMGLKLPAQSHRAAGDAIYTWHLVRALSNQYQSIPLPI